MSELSYVSISSRFGALGLVWREASNGPAVQHILLPDEWPGLKTAFPEARPGSCSPIDQLSARIEAYLRGETVALGLELLDMERCYAFQRRVLLVEYGIPRGWISTYGRVAAHLGAPRAARAVGTALGRNPFPIVIPCHRAVRSNGTLGGYRGGLVMKRALLEMEGIAFETADRVRMDKVWY